MKNVLILIIFVAKAFCQVAPHYLPFSIKNPEITLDYNTIHVNKLKCSYKEYASLTELDHISIYRLAIKLDGEKSGNIHLENWNIPRGAKLFIFNDDNSYTGPYSKNNTTEIISGRFKSNKIILEYIEPNESEFEGDFIISNIFSDVYINNENHDTSLRFAKYSNQQRPKIMVTGYWPPTNEMVRHFSQNIDLNPLGWEGENWQGLGFDVVSFFPEFEPSNCTNCGQGFGDLEVDYQDFSNDFWPIVESVKPIAIITFSRGFNDNSWELENRLVNRTNWHDDYTSPFLPTPNPPDDSVNNFHVRYNSLPINNIISAIDDAQLGLDPYLDNTNAGMYLSEFAGYHGVWYREIFYDNADFPCMMAGHIHVGGQIDWNIAKQAAEVSIEEVINYIAQYLIIAGDANIDGEINVLDVVSLSNFILGFIDFTVNQEYAADIDNNNILNVLDIIAIINIILS